ncbi:MAG: PEP-CTERM sorting domain-containing protein [Planctomycetota bacterium]|nr:PEP-CTERM sorting domain-containing protein [Planctomycetota bacterium]
MRSVYKFTALALIGGLAFVASGQGLSAQVIYHDNYTTHIPHGSIIGQPNHAPNVVNVPNGVYAQTVGAGGQGEHLNYADVGEPQGPGNYPFQVLSVKTDGGAGFKSTVSLPYAANLVGNTDKLKLTFTFRKPTGGVWDFNNLIFGFTGTGNPGSFQKETGQLDTFFRFESGGYVRAYVPGNVAVSDTDGRLELPFETDATEFGTYSIQYDPLKVSTQPWSLTRPDNATFDFPTLGGFIDYNPLTQITGVGFGTYGADTNQDRTMWMRDFKFERIAQPPIEAVPEPASVLLMGLAGVGLVAFVRSRRANRAK